MTTFTEATLLAFIAAHHCVPAKIADVMAAYAATESGYDTTKVNDHNPNGTKDVGIAQVNSSNFGWLSDALGQPVNEKTLLNNPCLNLAAGLRVLLVRYNGNPKDPIKIRYTNKLLDKLADTRAPAPVTASGAQSPSSVGLSLTPMDQITRPVRSGRDVIATRQ